MGWSVKFKNKVSKTKSRSKPKKVNKFVRWWWSTMHLDTKKNVADNTTKPVQAWYGVMGELVIKLICDR